MKILFKNTTKYNKENRDNFVNFHKEKYGRRELIKIILITVPISYILIYNIINISWYFLLIFVLCGFLFYFSNKYAAKKKKAKKAKQKNKEFTFYFYERYIKIRARRQFQRMAYFEIKKVFETEENFFLYLDDQRSMILDKDGFEIGKPKDFVDFIKRKCPFKYRNEEEK